MACEAKPRLLSPRCTPATDLAAPFGTDVLDDGRAHYVPTTVDTGGHSTVMAVNGKRR